MLEITIPEMELFDEKTKEFVSIKEQNLKLEHSLVSLSKWEAKWRKPFLDDAEHSTEEVIDYIRCMTITQNVDPNVYHYLPKDLYLRIKEYIATEQTATIIFDRRKPTPRKEKITSELIYYWMIYFNIPTECEKWHLSRLMTLIRICGIKGSNEKMSMNEIFAENNRLLKARRKNK